MKKTIAIFFLCLFVGQSISRLFILTIFHLNREAIAREVCVNRMDKIPVCKGQCVLDKNLKQADSNEENFPNLTIKVVNDYVHVATTITFSTPAQTLFNLVKKEDFAFIPERFNSDIFHPPTYSI